MSSLQQEQKNRRNVYRFAEEKKNVKIIAVPCTNCSGTGIALSVVFPFFKCQPCDGTGSILTEYTID